MGGGGIESLSPFLPLSLSPFRERMEHADPWTLAAAFAVALAAGAINSIAGERCSPHPHVFSDRLIRPGDTAYFDIIHAYNGYRTCYYRTFVVGRGTPAQRDAYKQAREWIDAAIALVFFAIGVFVIEGPNETLRLRSLGDVPAEKMFVENYLYFSSFSDLLLDHARQHARSLIESHRLGPDSLVVDPEATKRLRATMKA